MFAIIQTGGKQYQVSPAQTLDIEKIEASKDEVISFDQVLLISDENRVEVGTPFLDTVIKAKVVEQKKGEKINIIKYKAKSRYRRHLGHRQELTTVTISDFSFPKSEAKKSEIKSTPKTEKAVKTK